MKNCKVQFTVIRDIRKIDFAIFQKQKFWQSLIWTEELRPGLPAKTYKNHVKCCKTTAEHVFLGA